MAKKKTAVKGRAKKRGLNAESGTEPTRGAPPNEQDPKRRLGNFESAGEHARVGGRTKGIYGQGKKNKGG